MKKYEQELCQKEGLKYDAASKVFSVKKGDYSFMITRSQYFYILSVSVDGAMGIDGQAVREALKGNKILGLISIQGRRMNFQVKSGMTAKKTMENISQGIELLTQEVLLRQGYRNVCSHCGKATETAAYVVNGAEQLLCEDCFHLQGQAFAVGQAQKGKESFVGGLVGAFLGSLVGVAAILLLSQLGYIAIASGVVMGVCATKGYELLGRKLSKKGIVVSILLMFVMTVFAHRLDWTIEVVKELHWPFSATFINMSSLVEDFNITRDYYTDLVLLLGFTLVGAIPVTLSANNRRKLAGTAYRI